MLKNKKSIKKYINVKLKIKQKLKLKEKLNQHNTRFIKNHNELFFIQ